jgi:hypothetical protein
MRQIDRFAAPNYQHRAWVERCGFNRTGKRTTLTEEWVGTTGKHHWLPDPKALSSAHRREAAENLGKYFGWSVWQGVH